MDSEANSGKTGVDSHQSKMETDQSGIEELTAEFDINKSQVADSQANVATEQAQGAKSQSVIAADPAAAADTSQSNQKSERGEHCQPGGGTTVPESMGAYQAAYYSLQFNCLLIEVIDIMADLFLYCRR